MKIYEFALIFHPTSEDRKKGEKSKIIQSPTTVLANDEKTAMLLAGRSIPEEYLNLLDQVEVAIRPF